MGAELLIAALLGFVVLGPERMYEMLGLVGKAKARFDEATRGIRSQLALGIPGKHDASKPNDDLPRT